MKVLIGVDPHKVTVALAAVDEVGELIECASFSHNRAGLRSLERWAKRFPERRWAVENAGGLGRHLAGRLVASGESVVDVPSKLSARVRVLSIGNARKNDELDALATALAAWRNERLATVDPEADSEVLRLLSERPPRASTGPGARWSARNALCLPSHPHPARHTGAGLLGLRSSAVGFGGAARHPDTAAKDRRP